MSYNGLVAKATAISSPYKQKIADDDAIWNGSPFDWIRRLPSRTRGSIGQTLVESLFSEYGYIPGERKNLFEVSGKKIISRSSMLWEADHWRFQQVRNNQFDFLFCLGIFPDRVSAWFIPKEELYLQDGSITDREGWGRQHGGRAGKEDAWLIVYPNAVPGWLNNFGGDISKISSIFAKSI